MINVPTKTQQFHCGDKRNFWHKYHTITLYSLHYDETDGNRISMGGQNNLPRRRHTRKLVWITTNTPPD